LHITKFNIQAKEKNPFSHELQRKGPLPRTVKFSASGLSLDEVERQLGLERQQEIFSAFVNTGHANAMTLEPPVKTSFEYQFIGKQSIGRISLEVVKPTKEIIELSFEEFCGDDCEIPDHYFQRFLRREVDAFISKWESEVDGEVIFDDEAVKVRFDGFSGNGWPKNVRAFFPVTEQWEAAPSIELAISIKKKYERQYS
jgi:hypothetical protein